MQTAINRRHLGQLLLGAALVAALDRTDAAPASGTRIRLSMPGGPAPSDEDLRFMRDIGALNVYVGIAPQSEFDSVAGLQEIRRRYAAGGVTVSDVRNMQVTTQLADVLLGRPGAQQRIENFKTWLRTCGGAGFGYTVAQASVLGVLTSGTGPIRNGIEGREVDASKPLYTGLGPAMPGGQAAPRQYYSSDALAADRRYTPEEIWENYTRLVREIAPVAEEQRVSVGFHPDDPPITELGGIPRIFATFADCKKAIAIANSPRIGICLCAGTFAEGIADPATAIRYFGARRKMWEVHFRNVTAPLPLFRETFQDDGYYDMYKVMEALVAVDFDGVVHYDHAVPMVGGVRSYAAYAQGYMKALLQRAQRARGR